MSSLISYALLPSCYYKARRNNFVESSSCTTFQDSKFGQVAEKWVLALAAEPGLEDGVLGCSWWKEGGRARLQPQPVLQIWLLWKRGRCCHLPVMGHHALRQKRAPSHVSALHSFLRTSSLPKVPEYAVTCSFFCPVGLLWVEVRTASCFSPSQKGCNSLGG